MNRIVVAIMLSAGLIGVLAMVVGSAADITVQCGMEAADTSSVHGLSASPISRSLALLHLAC